MQPIIFVEHYLAANSKEHHQTPTSVCATHIQEETETLKMEILRLENKKKGIILQVIALLGLHRFIHLCGTILLTKETRNRG